MDDERTRWVSRDRPVIAHAMWSSAAGWEPRPIAIDYTGTAYDARRIHTGCIVRHAAGWLMFYSGSRRHVCLATSDDLETWQKHPANPILTPDSRLYGPYWRDPWVYQDPVDNLYTMVLAAQPPPADSSAAGVAGVARSHDLVHWEQQPPLDAPPWFEWLEVPELHRINGQWYLLFATQTRWITEIGREGLQAQDVPAETGAFCLTADDWRGPYRCVQRLFPPGSPRYTTRLVAMPDGERCLWSHGDWMQDGQRRLELLPPVTCDVSPDGRLVLRSPG